MSSRAHVIRRLVLIGGIAAVTVIVAYGVQKLRSDAKRNEIKNQMRAACTLVLSEGIPEDGPTGQDGKPIWSWRFPTYTMRLNVGQRPDLALAWNDERNSYFLDLLPDVYCYGSTPESSVLAITGPGTIFNECKGKFPRECAPDAPDAILLIEVPKSGIHWMEPGDLELGTIKKTIVGPSGEIRGTFADGVFVAFADGEVWFLSKTVPFSKLKRFFTIKGAESSDRDKVLGPYRTK